MSETVQTEFRALLARQQMLNQRQQKRLARKIHDDISQKMTLLALQISLAATKGEEAEDWSKNCRDWSQLVMDLGQSIREITAELQPRIVDDSGLVSAFKWLAGASVKKISCEIVSDRKSIHAPLFAANELFSVCREVMADCLIPAKVPGVEITLHQSEDSIRVTMRCDKAEDGGTAITEEGLRALAARERLAALDGALELTQSDAGESILALTIPVACAATAPAH